MDTTTAQEYYANLLLEQYVNKPKAVAHIKLLTSQIYADLVALDIQNAFNINTAVGDQLDVLGQYIGLSRKIEHVILKPFFTSPDYSTYTSPVVGFTSYLDSSQNAYSYFQKYGGSNITSNDLDDVTYRVFLKLKIILNSLDNTYASITQVLWDFFAGKILAYDLGNMSLGYYVTPEYSYIVELAAANDLLPRPIGVGINYIIVVPSVSLVFGFQDYLVERENTTGFSTYSAGFNGLHFVNYGDVI